MMAGDVPADATNGSATEAACGESRQRSEQDNNKSDFAHDHHVLL